MLSYINLLLLSSACSTFARSVDTTSGKVSGHASNTEDIEEFLGIPFAKPPIEDLRFAAPVAYDGKGKEIEAKAFGPSCPFVPFAPLQEGPIPGWEFTPQARTILSIGLQTDADITSEDCLTLNLFVPTTPTLKPVMIYLYGGGFTSGSSSLYPGAALASEQDLIIVTVNYRTTIFGFSGAPGSALNAGILDQRLALEWVRDNIPVFGGDPTRITLFGESAGGTSTDYHTFAWPDEPIASGFIEQSGTALMTPAVPVANAALNFANVSSTLGCEGSDVERLACVRTRDTQEIMDAATRLNTHTALGGYMGVFFPTADEEVVFADYPALLREGKFSSRPVLLGANDHESGLLAAIEALALGAANIAFAGSRARWETFERVTFECGAALRSKLGVEKGGKTFRYVYYGDFENTRLTESPPSGAYHGAEGRPMWDMYTGLPPPSEDQKEFGKEWRGLLASFARDPRGFEEVWKEYKPGEETVRRLAVGNKAGSSYVKSEDVDFFCPEHWKVFGEAGVTHHFDTVGEETYERLAGLSN